MTEDEAKENLCPLYAIAITSGNAAHIPATNAHAAEQLARAMYKASKCKASNCMMWRWNRNPDHALWHVRTKRPDHLCLEDGYCGLAGEVKPPSHIDFDLAKNRKKHRRARKTKP